MFKLYVGLADRNSLASFFREGTVPMDWLILWADARHGQGVVPYQAVLTEEDADAVRAEMDHGRRVQALNLLHAFALELRPLGRTTTTRLPDRVPGS